MSAPFELAPPLALENEISAPGANSSIYGSLAQNHMN